MSPFAFAPEEKEKKIATIGCPIDLTYPTDHLGNSPYVVYKMAQGKHMSLLDLLRSTCPHYILG